MGPHHLPQLHQLIGLSWLQQRAVMLGTVMCCWVFELTNLQICDLPWNFNAPYHLDLRGGIAVRIYKRKQGTGCFGLFPHILPGAFVEKFQLLISSLGLRTAAKCTKKRARAEAGMRGVSLSRTLP